MLLNSRKCDFFGAGRKGRQGNFKFCFFPCLVFQHSLTTTVALVLGTPSLILVIYQIPASAQCFPAEMEPLKEASRMK